MKGDRKNKLAATYSRGSYTTTTIGNAAFDGRVRDGIGSDHCFMATKKMSKERVRSLKTTHRSRTLTFRRALKSLSLNEEKKRSSLTTD